MCSSRKMIQSFVYCTRNEFCVLLGQVTKRVDTNEKDWGGWDWRTEGDIMVNGAYFVPSGAALGAKYAKAYSVEPKSAGLIDQLTMNAGVLGGNRYLILSPLTVYSNFFSVIIFNQLFIYLVRSLALKAP